MIITHLSKIRNEKTDKKLKKCCKFALTKMCKYGRIEINKQGGT